jgi:ABC-type multidrug transport system ATPase subunit
MPVEQLTVSTISRISYRNLIMSLVGNEFVRGVSGGERKGLSLAETTLVGATLQAWDNSTRSLDSARSVRFCQTLRLGTDMFNNACVAIHRTPQAAYQVSLRRRLDWPECGCLIPLGRKNKFV